MLSRFAHTDTPRHEEIDRRVELTDMIHPIVKYPEAVLARKAEPVTEFGKETRRLVDDMYESMYAAQGIGLAAPQIGVSRRITVIDLSFQKTPEEMITLINPQIIEREGKQFEEEGCLSLPDIRAKVQRAATVKVRAQNVEGEWFEMEGADLLSRAFQHEIDHLEGVLFLDRVSKLKRDLLLHRIRKLIKAGDW